MPVPDALPEDRPLGIGVLASGAGTMFEALHETIRERGLSLGLVGVYSDRPRAPALERARRLGLAQAYVGLPGPDPDRWSQELDARLRRDGADAAFLDGFLSIVPPRLVRRWRGRLFNVHPSLLPKYGGPGFYGENVHRAVLAAGDAESGVTVHEVSEALDAGRIRAQRRLDLRAGETPQGLRERLRPLEVEALLEVLGTVSPRPE